MQNKINWLRRQKKAADKGNRVRGGSSGWWALIYTLTSTFGLVREKIYGKNKKCKGQNHKDGCGEKQLH